MVPRNKTKITLPTPQIYVMFEVSVHAFINTNSSTFLMSGGT